MKTSLKLVALILIFSFSSCSTEELTETNSETQSNIAKSTTYVNANVERLHNIMQWKAYLTAQVLLNNNEARGQFLALYQANGNVIQLSDLLDNTFQTESFKNALRDEFHRYILYPESCPQTFDRTRDRPTPPQLPGNPQSIPGFISWVFNTSGDELGVTEEETNEERFQHFLELILQDNCFEIYLPNGYSTFARNIKSSAHPLLDQNFNDEAYKHVASCNVGLVSITERNSVTGNIIIVRPKRFPAIVNSNCHYSEYDFDFTDFLD